MTLTSWINWARLRGSRRPRTKPKRSTLPLRLTQLEDRSLPATFLWINAGGGDFASGTNWRDQAGNTGVPGAGDDALILNAGINVTSSGATTVRNLTSKANLQITGGTLTADAANLLGLTTISGGALVLNKTSTASEVDLTGGSLGGIGPLRVTDEMTWTGGTLAGGLQILDEATLEINGAAVKAINGGTLINDGTVQWLGDGDLEFRSGASVRNLGVFEDLTADNTLLLASGSATFFNIGKYRKSTGTTDVGIRFDNTGALWVDGSSTFKLNGEIAQIEFGGLRAGTWYVGSGCTLNFVGETATSNSAAVTLGGLGATISGLNVSSNSGSFTLAGGANFTNNTFFYNSGNIRIGPASTFTVEDYSQSSSGALTFEIAGRPGSGFFGKLQSTDSSSLNGMLQLRLVDGADTQEADAYSLLTSTTLSGSFSSAVQDRFGTTTVFSVA